LSWLTSMIKCSLASWFTWGSLWSCAFTCKATWACSLVDRVLVSLFCRSNDMSTMAHLYRIFCLWLSDQILLKLEKSLNTCKLRNIVSFILSICDFNINLAIAIVVRIVGKRSILQTFLKWLSHLVNTFSRLWRAQVLSTTFGCFSRSLVLSINRLLIFDHLDWSILSNKLIDCHETTSNSNHESIINNLGYNLSSSEHINTSAESLCVDCATSSY